VLHHVGHHLIVTASGVLLYRMMLWMLMVVLVYVIAIMGLVRLDVVDLFLRSFLVPTAHHMLCGICPLTLHCLKLQ
jgi:hypothetical protein